MQSSTDVGCQQPSQELCVRHLFLQPSQILVVTLKNFSDSPQQMLEGTSAESLPSFLGVSPHSPPAPGNLQGKASQKSTPTAHCYYQSLNIWWPYVLLGAYPNRLGLCSTSPALVVVHLPAPYLSLVGLPMCFHLLN